MSDNQAVNIVFDILGVLAYISNMSEKYSIRQQMDILMDFSISIAIFCIHITQPIRVFPKEYMEENEYFEDYNLFLINHNCSVFFN